MKELEATESEETVTVTLRFKSHVERDRFMGGLSHGFGENHCSLDWPQNSGVSFYECDRFDVTVYANEWDDEE